MLSNRPFARKFKKNDPVLNKIDREILKRRFGGFTYGGWCSEDGNKGNNSCSLELRREKFGVLRPGAGGRRLRTSMMKLVSAQNLGKRQCR